MRDEGAVTIDNFFLPDYGLSIYVEHFINNNKRFISLAYVDV